MGTSPLPYPSRGRGWGVLALQVWLRNARWKARLGVWWPNLKFHYVLGLQQRLLGLQPQKSARVSGSPRWPGGGALMPSLQS